MQVEIKARGGLTYYEHHYQEQLAGHSDENWGVDDATVHHLRRELSLAGEGFKNLTEMADEEIETEELDLHLKLIKEFSLVSEELDFILNVSAVAFIFPIQQVCRYIGAKKTERTYTVTMTDYLDIFVFVMVAWVWSVVEDYKLSPLREHLFGPEEDSDPKIRFIANVVYDITHGIFHLDYFMAAVTALLWFRANMQLRLTETFGPLLVMIYRMV